MLLWKGTAGQTWACRLSSSHSWRCCGTNSGCRPTSVCTRQIGPFPFRANKRISTEEKTNQYQFNINYISIISLLFVELFQTNSTTCAGQSHNAMLTFPGPVYSQVAESFWQPPLLVSQGLMGTQCFPSPTNPCSHVHRKFPLLNRHFAFASQMPGEHTPAITSRDMTRV